MDRGMVDMKRKSMPMDQATSVGGANYPHTLYLDKEDIKKLGISGCKLGDEKMLMAKVRVTSASSSESEGGDKSESVTLTITEAMVHSAEEKSHEKRAEKMYGKS